MCLNYQRPTKELYDAVGWKVVERRFFAGGRWYYRGLFSETSYLSGWMAAEEKWSVVHLHFGFHAYIHLEDAKEALQIAKLYAQNYEGSYRNPTIIKVELANVFGIGEDNSFPPTDYKSRIRPQCLLAQSMRILEEVS